MPHRPHPKQLAFLCLPHLEALYGGAASGGKSDAQLMAALQYVDVPGYAAIIFRRTYADLVKPGAVMERAQQWLRFTDAAWNGTTRTWTFPSSAVLTFGHLEHEEDKREYASTEFQYEGFDEATDFSESQYTFLLSRLRRRVGIEAPLRARLTSNPGGPGHEWVKRRFITEGLSHGRPFIPARLEDNPSVDRTEYERSLAQLDAIDFERLRNGNWEADLKGKLFERSWFKTIEVKPEGYRWVRYWDLAASEVTPDEAAAGKKRAWTVGALVGFGRGRYCIADIRRKQLKPMGVEELVHQTAEADGVEVPIWMEQEPGSGGVNTIDHYAREVLAGFTFEGDKKTGDKVDMARPLSSAAQKGNVDLVRGDWNGEFLREAHAFPTRGVAKDQIDAASGGQRKLTGPTAAELLEMGSTL